MAEGIELDTSHHVAERDLQRDVLRNHSMEILQ